MKLTFNDSYLGKLRKIVGSQPLIVPGFRIIIENINGEILLIKRSDNGMWGLPAGSPELKESMSDCILREVFEETGLKINKFECFGFASNPISETHTYPNGDQIQNFSLLLYTNNWHGNYGVNDNETTDVRFFSPNMLPAAELILKHELSSIPQYFDYKKTGRFQWS